MQEFTVGNLITSYRSRLGLKQHEVANPDDPACLSISLRTYQSWENGERIPPNAWLQRIASFFRLTDAEADELYRAAAQTAPKIQNFPAPRNHFFTGRETYLEQLDRLFKEQGRVAITQPVSICGLGGIGKTQLALEYAYRCYPQAYRAVLWANASDKVTLENGYVTMANLLQLPVKDEREVDRIVQAVKMWLENHTNWLLILDNADDLAQVRSFLPNTPGGHILLTTRSQLVSSLASPLMMQAMEPEEGLLFLLRRTRVLSDADELATIAPAIRDLAAQLVDLLGGHALALDQAGAYIEETQITFATYIQRYTDYRLHLLDMRGFLETGHPESVVVTFAVSFQRAYELCPTAADVLHFCCFLHPDAIPEELFRLNERLTTDLLAFDKAIAALHRYSLIRRQKDEQLFFIHRLVQAVLQETMEQEQVRNWVIQAVQTVKVALHDELQHSLQARSGEQYLAHALRCTEFVNHYALVTPEAASLLTVTGSALQDRAQYQQAESLLLRAVEISQQCFGSDRPETTAYLNNLALLYKEQGRFREAEELLQQAVIIREQVPDLDPAALATCLDNLADVCLRQFNYTQAEQLSKRALSIYEDILGPDDIHTARCLTNLANCCANQKNYSQAILLLQRALSITEKNGGADDVDAATVLNSLAWIYKQQHNYSQAEPLYQRALRIREQQWGPDHPYTAESLNNLAKLYVEQEQYREAEELYRRVLTVNEQFLGLDHPHTMVTLRNLAELYIEQEKESEAVQVYQRLVAIGEQHREVEPAERVVDLYMLARLHQAQEDDGSAETCYQRSLALQAQIQQPEHEITRSVLTDLAHLYSSQRRYQEAEPLYQRILVLSEQQFGADHLYTATSLNNLALLYHYQGRYQEAEPLYQRSLSIWQRLKDSDTQQDRATCLQNLALLYTAQGRYQDAEAFYLQSLPLFRYPSTTPKDLYQRTNALYNLASLYHIQGRYQDAEEYYQQALMQREQMWGANHPDIAPILSDLADLSYVEKRFADAEPLLRRALSIYEEQPGETHPITQHIAGNYLALLRLLKREEEARTLQARYQKYALHTEYDAYPHHQQPHIKS